MVRLADLPDWEREQMLARVATLPRFEETPCVGGPPLAQRRVALVTTAGLHRRGDDAFATGAADYRVIPGDTSAADLVMSHSSVNFDRSGFQEDVNIVFPIDRLRECAREGFIGSVADFHYAFMGAVTPITRYEPAARQLATLLAEDRVDAVLLSPV